MKIDFLVNEVYRGWEPDDLRLGGTEESVVEWANCLQKRGHQVRVYRNGTGSPHPNNYFEREEYLGDGDVCVNVKSYDVAPKEPTLYLTNETNATQLDLSGYDGVIWPSQWAVDNIETNAQHTFILPHGYNPENVWSDKKYKKQCIYTSSPDRGLSTLLEVWPSVYEKNPDATLILTYGAVIPPTPGVINLGEIEEDTMNELYRTSDYWLHPCSGGELYCISGIKAQASGCIPVIIPRMALSETVRDGYFAKDESDYASVLNMALNAPDEAIEAIRTGLLAEKYPTWETSTSILEEILKKVYAKAK